MGKATRRADRLFEIIQLLRRRKLARARDLAEALEVTERTIYRDVRDLMASGVPIEGEAGVGYVLRRGFDLPPLMFGEQEIEALVLGARIVESSNCAQRGFETSDRMRASLASITEHTTRVRESMSNIGAACQAQRDGSVTIERHLQDVQQQTESSAAMSQELSATIGAMSEELDQLSTQIEQFQTA